MLFCVPAANAVEYRFYHSDPLGSNVVVTDRSGQVIQRTAHTPYGELRSVVDGSGQSIVAEADQARHLFTGQEYEPESGLHYFGARHYDPFIGRFLSVDPLVLSDQGPKAFGDAPGSFNTHAYAFGRPTVFIDPTGEQAVVPPVCGPLCAVLSGLSLVVGGLLAKTVHPIFLIYQLLEMPARRPRLHLRPRPTEHRAQTRYPNQGLLTHSAPF